MLEKLQEQWDHIYNVFKLEDRTVWDPLEVFPYKQVTLTAEPDSWRAI